jgi:hypothetical protein
MNEPEWLACTDPQPMLEYLRGKISDRKLRLFACANGRRYLDRMYREDDRRIHEHMVIYQEKDRHILDVEERYADGAVPMEALVAAYEAAGNDPVDASDAASFDPYLSAYYINAYYLDRFRWGPDQTVPEAVRWAQCALLRDLVGNPFRPVAAAADGPTPRTRTFARGIYEARAFDHLPLLADALEDAGCPEAELLGHLREPGPHVLGCWALDFLLGKS